MVSYKTLHEAVHIPPGPAFVEVKNIKYKSQFELTMKLKSYIRGNPYILDIFTALCARV